jgi:molybdenum-dependent DNA-binding transcriptional regulator ModE
MSEIKTQTLSVIEAAKALGICPKSAWRAVKRGDIPVLRIGGRVLVLKSVLDRMLDGSIKIAERVA